MAGRASGNKSSGAPIAVPSSTSRRQAYVSVNHLLSFEVASSASNSAFLTSTPPKRPTRRPPGAVAFTKERFIHAKYAMIIESILFNLWVSPVVFAS